MVVLLLKGIQKLSRNIFLQDAVYDAVRKQTFVRIQETKIEYMKILQ